FPRQTAEIAFRRIPLSDLLDAAYFLEEDPHDRGPLRWKRLTLTQLGGFRAGAAGSLDRAVIIPRRAGWPVDRTAMPPDVFIPDAPLADRVLEDSGASAGSAITRWSAKGLWVVDDPQAARTFAIDAGGLRRELPRCELEVFDILDGLPPGGSIA